MSGPSADSIMMTTAIAKLLEDSSERMSTMQHQQAIMNAELAKTQAELNLKAIAAVSASSAKLAVQPATLNGGVSGLAPSPGDVMAWLEDIKTKFNAIQNGIRAFVAGLIRDPRGSASDFKARLTEAENIALYVCINEKIPKSLKTMIWPSQVQEGTGLLYALLQHAINPPDRNVTIKRSAKFFVETQAMPMKSSLFQATYYLQLQIDMLNVRWGVGINPADLIGVIKSVFSNFHTISTSITDYWNASAKNQEAVDETMAHIPSYMDRYMELNNRVTDAKEESSDWQVAGRDKKPRPRSQSDPSQEKPAGDTKDRSIFRPAKPPLLKTPEVEREKNGPCIFHKKGDCAWKEYCTMDHSPAAMAKIPVVPRRPPHSARNAKARADKEEMDKDEMIAVMFERLEQLEGKLTLMFRARVQNAGVRAALLQPLNTVRASTPRPTSYLAAVKSHLSRTEVWSRPTMEKIRAPTYLAALRKSLEMTRSNQGIPPKTHKGPLIDSCADINVCAESEKHLLSNSRAAPDISIEGIAGPVKPTLMGDRIVGGIAIQEMMLIPGAKESVVAHVTLWGDPNLKAITDSST